MLATSKADNHSAKIAGPPTRSSHRTIDSRGHYGAKVTNKENFYRSSYFVPERSANKKIPERVSKRNEEYLMVEGIFKIFRFLSVKLKQKMKRYYVRLINLDFEVTNNTKFCRSSAIEGDTTLGSHHLDNFGFAIAGGLGFGSGLNTGRDLIQNCPKVSPDFKSPLTGGNTPNLVSSPIINCFTNNPRNQISPGHLRTHYPRNDQKSDPRRFSPPGQTDSGIVNNPFPEKVKKFEIFSFEKTKESDRKMSKNIEREVTDFNNNNRSYDGFTNANTDGSTNDQRKHDFSLKLNFPNSNSPLYNLNNNNIRIDRFTSKKPPKGPEMNPDRSGK
jgi:hypothetical protein